jgi:Sec-independent protein secretion pathway component TatC
MTYLWYLVSAAIYFGLPFLVTRLWKSITVEEVLFGGWGMMGMPFSLAGTAYAYSVIEPFIG